MKEDISCQCQKFSARGRNSLSEKEILCQRKKFFVRGRNSLSEEEIFCRKKKILDKGRNLFSEQTEFIRGRNFLSKEEISCRKEIFLFKFPVIERNVLSEEDFCNQMKKFTVTGRNLQAQEKNLLLEVETSF